MMGKLRTYVNKYFSNGPKTSAVIIAVLVIILTAVIFNMRKTITISVDGTDKKITTFSSNYGKILNDNKIKVGPKDKVTPSLNSKVYNNGKLYIKRAVKLEVAVDGRKVHIYSAEDDVFHMLEAEKIKLRSLDRVSPSGDLPLKNGLKVSVTRIDSKEVRTNKSIKYETVVKDDADIQLGSKKVIQEGRNGEKETVTRIIYENGKETARKVIREVVKKQPVQKVVAMGTLSADAVSYTPSRGGNFSYAKSLQMRSTAYTADYESTGKGPGDPGFGITVTGTVARRSNVSSVAVDPRVIPLGTRLYIDGYGYAIAEDTGGAIKGNRLDLFFNSSSEANNWGVKMVNVYFIE
ncbi:MAG: 3D domain-containing protein [Clostridium tyrobutyricum]|uniref:3D domain-containing protein n=1 Tax=Clostridium tyrobutyricum TaxID=1519 RepID=UPI002430A0A4|nr:3D domain-containing protein [Clostridium tyrobutyricum]MCH4238546.1 3D domain-containing protein [Clostridium tyrobutyricum]MCH4260271.1 3D domain-containing protein [Clostridium tyrobutyricum]MCI1653468.1 3D domain-containing protein [Clostridium tyrobutyricum]MCI1938777.1 3D domain-containing protein [Clostridium tyrobutyricum]MCI1994192.1 3D domain-containing protein [Clostridium tyrobutyricum]